MEILSRHANFIKHTKASEGSLRISHHKMMMITSLVYTIDIYVRKLHNE